MAVDVSTLPVRVAPARRFPQLLAGLALYAVSMAMMLRARLGLAPWDVLHQGLAHRLALDYGVVTASTGALVLLMWWPLRQRPGVGTVANVVVIAFVVDLALAVLPVPHALPARVALLVGGVVGNAAATAGYVGARLGPGPRDGLMTGIGARTGVSIRVVRTVIEVLVLAGGWVLGGDVGVGTVLYALGIGPLTQWFLRALAYRPGVVTCWA